MESYPSRPAGSTYMGDFCAPKLETVRMGFIGVGRRGSSMLSLMLNVPGAEVVGVCDIHEDVAKAAGDMVLKKSGKEAKVYYGDEQTYIKFLKEVKPDVVLVAPSWEWHARVTCDVMLYGAHVLVEVPMAVSIKELWEIVDTSEKTKKVCMQLENCNYGREELLFLNMVRQGAIGELLHGEAAYIHDLRYEMKDEHGRHTGSWRTYHYAKRNGNVYPTHGLGPVAQYMNLARGEDNFGRLVSYSSPALGRKAFAEKTWPADHKWNKLAYECGDINTSIIKTTLGRTIMLQWDETSPRPYSRHNLIQGTLGTLTGYPTRVAGELLGDGNYHKWIQDTDMDELYNVESKGLEELYKKHKNPVFKEAAELTKKLGGNPLQAIYDKYEHPLFKRAGEIATKMGGHGGMDYLMLYRAIECFRKGEPMDQNVYEGAYWCACAELTEKSVAMGGMPQLFPDFTRGDWKTTKPLGIVE